MNQFMKLFAWKNAAFNGMLNSVARQNARSDRSGKITVGGEPM
jgi:hypothetical protein